MKNKIILFNVIMLVFFTFNYLNGFSKYKLDVIVIDAGHGGKDPGAVGKISYEKNIALKISLANAFGKDVIGSYIKCFKKRLKNY